MGGGEARVRQVREESHPQLIGLAFSIRVVYTHRSN